MKRGSHWYRFRKAREPETTRYRAKIRVDGSVIYLNGNHLNRELWRLEQLGLLERETENGAEPTRIDA